MRTQSPPLQNRQLVEQGGPNGTARGRGGRGRPWYRQAWGGGAGLQHSNDGRWRHPQPPFKTRPGDGQQGGPPAPEWKERRRGVLPNRDLPTPKKRGSGGSCPLPTAGLCVCGGGAATHRALFGHHLVQPLGDAHDLLLPAHRSAPRSGEARGV